MNDQLRIASLKFNRCGDLQVYLRDGRMIDAPLGWYPRLQAATQQQRSRWQIVDGGCGISWPEIGEHLSLVALIRDVDGEQAAGGPC